VLRLLVPYEEAELRPELDQSYLKPSRDPSRVLVLVLGPGPNRLKDYPKNYPDVNVTQSIAMSKNENHPRVNGLLPPEGKDAGLLHPPGEGK